MSGRFMPTGSVTLYYLRMIKKTLCFTTPTSLSLSNKQIVIKSIGDRGSRVAETTRPIEDIGVIVIESEHVTLTSSLISYLLANNVALITCDKTHMPQGMLLNLTGHTEQSERFQAQISATKPLAKRLWQQTVSAKIYNQASCLSISTDIETGCMFRWAKQVNSGDTNNLEGRAAAYYWQNLFPEHIHFTRDRYGDAPNHLFNYGYIILRSIIARALVSSGLMPILGIHHHNRYNSFCLADDIMEPYRPYVDLLVLDIIRQYGFNTSLTTEIKRQLLTLPVTDVNINGRQSPLMVAASTTTSSLAKCFLGQQSNILYPTLIPSS